jgi:hypothetical protein
MVILTISNIGIIQINHIILLLFFIIVGISTPYIIIRIHHQYGKLNQLDSEKSILARILRQWKNNTLISQYIFAFLMIGGRSPNLGGLVTLDNSLPILVTAVTMVIGLHSVIRYLVFSSNFEISPMMRERLYGYLTSLTFTTYLIGIFTISTKLLSGDIVFSTVIFQSISLSDAIFWSIITMMLPLVLIALTEFMIDYWGAQEDMVQ